jgi:hypothetical protein
VRAVLSMAAMPRCRTTMGCLIAFRIAAQRSAVFTASDRPLPLPAGIRAFLLAAGLSSFARWVPIKPPTPALR